MDLILIKRANRTDISLLKGIVEHNQIKSLVKSDKGDGFIMRAESGKFAGRILSVYSS